MENKKDYEIIVDSHGENLDISSVATHLNVAKPNPKEKKEEIIVPNVKKIKK